MSKKTIICLWWLKEKNFKILTGTLSLKLRIGVLKILILMAIKLDSSEDILKISVKNIFLDKKVIDQALYWLASLNMIEIVKFNDEMNGKDYWVKYSLQEESLRYLYENCWVQLPKYKILKFIRQTPNDQNITYEAISNYLIIIKGPKEQKNHLIPLIYDEEYLNGNFKDSWRELLVKYGLVEFLDLINLKI